MITFILLAVGALLVVGAVIVAYGANRRRRAGQSGQAVAEAQTEQMTEPKVGRPSGMN